MVYRVVQCTTWSFSIQTDTKDTDSNDADIACFFLWNVLLKHIAKDIIWDICYDNKKVKQFKEF